jgi:pimeloyl-ACP methyl ester carboxylesterase
MDRLGEITAPTLVVAGRDDFIFPPEHQRELAAAIPHATCGSSSAQATTPTPSNPPRSCEPSGTSYLHRRRWAARPIPRARRHPLDNGDARDAFLTCSF